MPELLRFERSPKKAMMYYFLLEGLSFMISLIVFIALIFLWGHFNWWHFLVYVFIGLLLVNLIYALIVPWIKYRFSFYKINHRHVEIKRYFYNKSLKLIKLERIQFIKTSSNPLLKKWGLVKVMIITAGHELEFPLMKQSDADNFEKLALDYLKGVDSDV
ncbi:PH domain-containing protein [Staphylococcus sp. ACRSN]|uniref:PH domain-containing protein n=1 Tax=Staphylococcus sp. ACRSN TaxID=2918214 RepID=UPI001EF32F21|nr:PH domain-containing protein [Staphylococcus sp. ACRSN]MCG7340037.1 PH domain-containing protein [Staphylococcus sp. ACRSN]